MFRALLGFALAVLLLSRFASPALAVFGGRTIADGDLVARSVVAVLYRDATGALSALPSCSPRA